MGTYRENVGNGLYETDQYEGVTAGDAVAVTVLAYLRDHPAEELKAILENIGVWSELMWLS